MGLELPPPGESPLLRHPATLAIAAPATVRRAVRLLDVGIFESWVLSKDVFWAGIRRSRCRRRTSRRTAEAASDLEHQRKTSRRLSWVDASAPSRIAYVRGIMAKPPTRMVPSRRSPASSVTIGNAGFRWSRRADLRHFCDVPVTGGSANRVLTAIVERDWRPDCPVTQFGGSPVTGFCWRTLTVRLLRRSWRLEPHPVRQSGVHATDYPPGVER